MLSAELRFLIECCKITLLQDSDKELIELIENDNINWKKLKKMVIYHEIRPIVYESIKRLSSANINPDFLNYLRDSTKIKIVQNLLLNHELKKVEYLFEQNQIQALAFKGISWSNYLYSASYREGTDIDFLINSSCYL